MRLLPSFQGQFYPGHPVELAETVDALLRQASTPEIEPGRILGVLVPHAGYVYSGETAARALAAVAGSRPEAIVLMGPSHRVPVDGIHVFDVEGFETALGPVDCPVALAREIAADLKGASCGSPFPEHSLEVQLPILHRVLADTPVVAIAFGLPDLELARRLAERLVELARSRRLLVVATSDLSHYHSHEAASQLDGRFRDLLLAGDSHGLWSALNARETEACGAGPVLTLMEMARRNDAEFTVMDQRDSSHAFGDTDRVVGYISALALRPAGAEAGRAAT